MVYLLSEPQLVSMDLDKTREKAFEYARDCSKLIVTLSTGIVAFTVTFSKELGGLTPAGCLQRFFLVYVLDRLLGFGCCRHLDSARSDRGYGA